MKKVNESYLDTCKRKAAEALIAYATNSDESPMLESAFEALFEACECNVGDTIGIQEKRNIVARGVIINSIYALNHDQIGKAERKALSLAAQ